jgi:trk system potassium uptake protein
MEPAMSSPSSRRLVPSKYTLRLTTPRLLVGGFAAVMALGTLLLKLPASTQSGISWIDGFFVSVSAVSVTGLSTVDFPATFTSFGGAVVMGLIQVGGLGIMTLATLGALVVGNRVGFRSILSLREELGTIDSPRNTLKLVGQIAAFTLVLELVGAVLLSVGFLRRGLGLGEGLFQGVFHAIMAFCNAGFATLPDGDLLPYAGDPLVVVTLSVLIILGGLGFPVMANFYRYRSMRRFTLHSKLVLVTTAALLALGIASVAALEWTNPATLGGNPIGTRSLMALFQGVTPRTAGFSTVDYASMREPTLLLQTGLMFVGTAPTSTGGGVRITTLALLFLLILSLVRGGGQVRAFGRALPQALIAKAFVVLALSTLLVVAGTLALMVSDGLSLLPAMFEVTSAFGTAGLSLGVTPELSPFGKILIAVVMFLGRVGPITILVALAARQRPPLYKLPEEDIAIG